MDFRVFSFQKWNHPCSTNLYPNTFKFFLFFFKYNCGENRLLFPSELLVKWYKLPNHTLLFRLIFKITLFIYLLWLPWVRTAVRLSLVLSRSYSIVAVHRLPRQWLLLLQYSGSVVVVWDMGSVCLAARGIFLDQRSIPCPPALAGRFLAQLLDHRGSP